MNKLIAAAMIVLPLATVHAATVTYTDEAAFVSHISPDYYLEDFSTYTYGKSP